MIITTILIFVIVLGLLVFVHELGHFLVAKKSGMKVDEFGFGFPPRLFGFQKINGKFVWIWGHKEPEDLTKTVYSVNWIPLGGFVKIVGENNEGHENPQSFVNKSFGRRLATLAAGVVMNLILAWVLLSAGYMIGLPVAVDSTSNLPAGSRIRDLQTAVIEVLPSSPASNAGLQANDIISNIDGQSFEDAEALRAYILNNAGKTFSFQVKRGAELKNIEVSSQANPEKGNGPTGIVLSQIGKLSFPWYLSLWQGAKTTVSEMSQIATGLYKLFSSGDGIGSLGGPVKIAAITGEVAGLGFIYLLQFTAFLSVNLAILNALPIPALDGGRILFLVIEKIRGKANNQRIEQWANTIGFSLLLLLMLVVTVNDIIKMFQ